MTKAKVYRFRRYDIAIDDYRYSTRMATKEFINRIGAEIIPGSETEIDTNLLSEGMTQKDFDPNRKPLTPEDIARENAAARPTIYPDS
jgi:hypothetical protein